MCRPGGDGERADIIHAAAFARRDEIGHGVAGLLVGSRLLLPQRMKRGEQVARFIGVDFDVFLHAVRRERIRLRRALPAIFRARFGREVFGRRRIIPSLWGRHFPARKSSDRSRAVPRREKTASSRCTERFPRAARDCRRARPETTGAAACRRTNRKRASCSRLRKRQKRLRLARQMLFPRSLLFPAIFLHEIIF